MNKDNKRIIIISTVVLVIALILSVIGVSYAFFNLQVTGEDTTTKIEIATGVANGIVLSGKVEDFHITVDANDMAYKNIGDYYATDNQDKNYVKNKEDGIKNLGTININEASKEPNICNATIKLEFTTSILEKIQEGDFTLGLMYGEEETEIDLKNIPEEGTTIEFELDGNTNPTYIKAYLKLNNAIRDQSYLANQEMKVKVSVDSFVCEVSNKGKRNLKLLQSTTNEEYLKTYDGKTVEQLEQGEETEDELLRYVGTATDVNEHKLNNFICFGTTDVNECTKINPQTYMYRIIGITTSNVNTQLGLIPNQLKIIQAYSNDSKNGITWDADYKNNKTWDTAEVQTDYLNGTFLSSITGSVGTHQWSDLITSPKWYIADNNITDGSWTLTTEKDKTTLSANYKIGLMYASDYYDGCNKSPDENCWLYFKNGLSTSSSLSGNAQYEWTMSRHGYHYIQYYRAWAVYTSGLLYYSIYSKFIVRPVFYLTSDITLSGGGTEDNPFIIHT